MHFKFVLNLCNLLNFFQTLAPKKTIRRSISNIRLASKSVAGALQRRSMGAAASSSKYREIHGASEEDLKSVFAELTAEEKDRVEMALEAAEKPHTEHGWSDMMHRWEGDGHAHPEIEEEDLSKQEHDDEHWTIMDTFKLEKLFESIDVNGDGQVTKKEWEKALKEFGDDLRHTFGHTVDDIDAVFAKLDTDGDGTLSWEEFSSVIPKDD